MSAPGRRLAGRGARRAPTGPAPAHRTRTFDPLPPGAAEPAVTEWDELWLRAVNPALPGGGRPAQGRTDAEESRVDRVTVTPGRVTAPVYGTGPRPYLATVHLRVFGDDEWSVFLGAVAANPAWAAALTDGEMPQELAGTAEACGTPLLPQREELESGCSCPGPVHPCPHVAALCRRTARVVGAEPLVLLLMRGRGADELIEELGRRSAARAVRAAPSAPPALPERGAATEPGPLARAAFATGVRPALPPPLPAPGAAGQPPVLPSSPGGPDPEAVMFLAADAAARARAWLAGLPDDEGPFGEDDSWHDAVRLAATHPDLGARRTFSPLVARLARTTGHTAADLARAAAAWRQGGRAGLEVLESVWDPPAGDFDRARGLLAAAGLPRFPARRNRLTEGESGPRQLRYGRDGRWYPYAHHRQTGTWWPQGRAGTDPAAVLQHMYDRD